MLTNRIDRSLTEQYPTSGVRSDTPPVERWRSQHNWRQWGVNVATLHKGKCEKVFSSLSAFQKLWITQMFTVSPSGRDSKSRVRRSRRLGEKHKLPVASSRVSSVKLTRRTQNREKHKIIQEASDQLKSFVLWKVGTREERKHLLLIFFLYTRYTSREKFGHTHIFYSLLTNKTKICGLRWQNREIVKKNMLLSSYILYKWFNEEWLF